MKMLIKSAAIAITTIVNIGDAQVLNEDFKLTASDGAMEDSFGISVAIENHIVAVGAFRDDDNNNLSGSAYLFDASTGVQLFKLLPSDGTGGAEFGWSIDINNGIVAVGAVSDPVYGSGSGSAYLFDASTGLELLKLVPNDGEAFENFGWSIAIDNGVVAVGASLDDDNGTRSGSAYLFDASTGAQLFKLLPDDGAAQDRFGRSIAIDNGIVAVGSRLDDDNGVDSGSAYLFDASTGEQLFKLLPNDGAEGDEFGYSIAIDNNAVVVGSYLDDDNGSDSGSVYLFDASTGVQINKILPSDGMEGDEFGWSVAIDSGIVAAGGYRDDDNGEDSGSAYLFDASTGTQLYKLLPSNGKNGDLFSQSIHIHRRIVVVGVWGDDDNGINAGSAYLFDAVSTPCTPDITGDGVLDFFDVSAFLDAFANLNPIADFNRDGDFNFFDVSAFLQAFAAGCP